MKKVYCRGTSLFPSTCHDLNLNKLLSHVADTVLKNETKKQEIGFIADDTSPFIRYLFPLKDKIRYKWETSSFRSTSGTSHMLRLGFVLYADNQEIGCGEVKVAKKNNFSILDNDRARIGETLKRQLHARIMKAKDLTQMVTFAVFLQQS